MRTRLTFISLILLCFALPACCGSVGETKKLPDGPSGTVTGVVTRVEAGECYVESSDRASGIWVQGETSGLAAGDEVTVIGSLSTLNGERLLTASEITPTGEHISIAPLGLPLSRVGGATFGYQECVSDYKLVGVGEDKELQWVASTGLNNTGLLVTTWGKVTATSYSPANDMHWFHIDDGTGLTSDLKERGAIVYSAADVKQGQFVSVTGVSSVETAIDDPTHLIRTIRPKSSDDVQVRKDAVPEYPFSDEFGGDGVDPHWGELSYLSYELGGGWNAVGTLGVESGRLRIDIPPDTAQLSGPFSRQLVQCAEGDWDMEVKLSIVPTLGPQVYQCMGVALKDTPSESVPLMVKEFKGPEATWLAAITPQTSSYPDEITGRMHYVVADTQVGYPKTELNTFAKTAWFKVRKRGSTVYGSASTDGVNYTREYSTNCGNRCFVAVCAYSYGSGIVTGPFSGYCDYIRFTRVSE